MCRAGWFEALTVPQALAASRTAVATTTVGAAPRKVIKSFDYDIPLSLYGRSACQVLSRAGGF
jgi:hypothetical protein